MGLSATRLQHGPYDHTQQPGTNPTPQPFTPMGGTGFGSHIATALNGMQPPQQNQALTPQPLQQQAPQPLSPGLFPRLQNMANQGGMGGFLSQFMMHGMHDRQLASGLSPEEFQAQIEARRAARGLKHF